MTEVQDLRELGIYVLEKRLNLRGPTVHNPLYNDTLFGAKVEAGKITLRLLDLSTAKETQYIFDEEISVLLKITNESFLKDSIESAGNKRVYCIATSKN